MDFKTYITIGFWNIVIIAIISGIMMVVLSYVGCSYGRRRVVSKSPTVTFVGKRYYHDAHRGLFIRELKKHDVLSYKQGHGLICISEEDALKELEQQLDFKKAD